MKSGRLRNGKADHGEGYPGTIRMHEPDSPEISAADVPLRKPAGRSGMGPDRMGRKPGTDAGRSREAAKSGNHQTKEHGADYRPEKEGLTMTRKECENKILDLLSEIRSVISAYNPEIKSCWMAINGDAVWAYKLREDKNGEPIQGEYLIDAFRKIEGDENNDERMAV